jgi:GDP-L-fucose synthase
MITKFHNAKVKNENTVTLWGDGTPLREFLNVDDLAKAIFFCMNNNLQDSLYNVGSDDEVSIKQLAEIVKDIIGYQGKIIWDSSFPNGTPRKKLDSSRLNKLGWTTEIKLIDGIRSTYEFFLTQI